MTLKKVAQMEEKGRVRSEQVVVAYRNLCSLARGALHVGRTFVFIANPPSV